MCIGYLVGVHGKSLYTSCFFGPSRKGPIRMRGYMRFLYSEWNDVTRLVTAV